MAIGYIMAEKGKQFVLTQKGYLASPDKVKPEREVGKPVFPNLGFDTSVPISWITNGYVEEVAL